jgi:cholesterol oxidase
MKRLSTPITELKHAYDVVVIGSGYGGSIAASRMARSGKKVCLLEKGKEFIAGEFPSTLLGASGEMHVAKPGKDIGPTNGLYEFVIGKDISVFKGCGLGGTSLVNANVSIEPEDRVFLDERWPSAIRNNLNELKEGFEYARQMLKPSPYPEGKNGYPVLSKTAGMRKSAREMNEEFRLLDLNVNFEDHINHVGIEQKKCNNCGDCVTGCNHHAKNTTTVNYLPDARNHGAEIYTEAGVNYIKKNGSKWLIYFELYGTGREKFDAPHLFITADMVFLSAGALGSTEILLRSVQHGLSVSDMLGKRFTGNGDVLGFGYNNDVPINGIGVAGRTEKGRIENVGPCITSIIDMRNRENLEEGMTLEEGSVPGSIRSVLLTALLPLSKLMGKDTDSGFIDYLKEKWRELKSLIRGTYNGAINNTQVYLVMTHDSGEGKMHLEKNQLTISWPGVGKEKIFEKVNDNLQRATKALGGTYVNNPSWTKSLDYDLVTVHPLGGCVMGADASSGVVDHKGEVFSGKKGTGLHKGLFVMDGAVIPRPLGTNPLLTISALAERSCKLIAKEFGVNLNYSFPTIQQTPTPPTTTGVQFTETMTGHFSKDETVDYQKARELGEKQKSPFEFTLTIQSQDVDKFVADKDHEAGMIGTVKAPGLSAHPLSISEGRFNLFVIDANEPGKKKMKYAMKMHTYEGNTYYFKGYKEIENNKGIDVWKDTTVLYVTIYNGADEKHPVLGRGMLKIELADFVKQLTTMKAVHETSKNDGIKSVAKFGKLFAGNVVDTYV